VDDSANKVYIIIHVMNSKKLYKKNYILVIIIKKVPHIEVQYLPLGYWFVGRPTFFLQEFTSHFDPNQQ